MVCVVAEHPLHCGGFHQVVQAGAGPVRIDVVNIGSVQLGLAKGPFNGPNGTACFRVWFGDRVSVEA